MHIPFVDEVGGQYQVPLTISQGVRDSITHGEDFGSVYRDMLNFLPHGFERDKYEWRVTNNFLTTQTLSKYSILLN